MSTDQTQHRRTTLQDRADLTDLVYRLGACLDEHRFDDLPGLFTEDVSATTPGGTATGIEAIVAQAVRNHAEFGGLHHVMTNVLVDTDGDQASIRANVVGTFVRDGLEPARRIGGLYRFRARRTANGWRLAGFTVTPIWLVGERPIRP